MVTRYRIIETYNSKGKLIATEQVAYEVDDEVIDIETKILDLLDDNWTASQSVAILKRLIRRLLKKGVLP